MASAVREVLARAATVSDVVAAFRNEERCRGLMEAMVWPRGSLVPRGCRESTALGGRDVGGECAPALINNSRAPAHHGLLHE